MRTQLCTIACSLILLCAACGPARRFMGSGGGGGGIGTGIDSSESLESAPSGVTARVKANRSTEVPDERDSEGGGQSTPARSGNLAKAYAGLEEWLPEFREGLSSSLICANRVLPPGATGDEVCESVDATCVKTVRSDGFLTLHCGTDSTTIPGTFAARCCQIRAGRIALPLAFIDLNVPKGTTGDAVGAAVGGACAGVVGNSGLQSLYCSTDTVNGQDPLHVARCIQGPRRLQCTNASVSSTGKAACAALGRKYRCLNVVARSGRQSLHCETPLENGDPNERGWLARCCR